MKFNVVHNINFSAKDEVFLIVENWNDFSYRTLYRVVYKDLDGRDYSLGNVKVGFYNQKPGKSSIKVGDSFTQIGEDFFSVGTDLSYYERLNSLGKPLRDRLLNGLNDIAKNAQIFKKALREDVTKIALLREVSEKTITGQFRRVANGEAPLIQYDFSFRINNYGTLSELNFEVDPWETPPSNIHVVTGRNGVGKTFLIQEMFKSLCHRNHNPNIMENNFFFSISEEFFANYICVSFSAFDEFEYIPEKKDKLDQVSYTYIGLKDSFEDSQAESGRFESRRKFVQSIFSCLRNGKDELWLSAIKILESDPVFKSLNLSSILEFKNSSKDIKTEADKVYHNLSSGHKIVLLTITRIVESIQEKSLILFDEPESHLHPPLLSSFIRAISELLKNRNGVAIMTTHSPIILQEVPKKCVWKIRRVGNIVKFERPLIETFGENVGTLTNEIFGLEVSDSGFHKILKELVEDKPTYEEALQELNGQLGLEGKSILRSLYYQRG